MLKHTEIVTGPMEWMDAINWCSCMPSVQSLGSSLETVQCSGWCVVSLQKNQENQRPNNGGNASLGVAVLCFAKPNGNKSHRLMEIIAEISYTNYPNSNLLFTSIITYLLQSVIQTSR